ncbi:MAG: DUF397 domain-containing protein [Pseudonocardiaceae bacterium]
MNHHDAHTALTAAGWHKSRYSQAESGCVEITTAVPGWVGIRDTKLGPTSPILALTHTRWTAFTAGVRNGDFD